MCKKTTSERKIKDYDPKIILKNSNSSDSVQSQNEPQKVNDANEQRLDRIEAAFRSLRFRLSDYENKIPSLGWLSPRQTAHTTFPEPEVEETSTEPDSTSN